MSTTFPKRVAPLAMAPDEFKRLGHDLVDRLAELLASVPSRPVTRSEPPSAVRQALDINAPLPETGTDAATLLADTSAKLFDHSLFNGHPRFFGYITASPAPIGMLGDLLASALNPNVSNWMLAPGAIEVELQATRWIAQLIGFPTSSQGILVSGGNMANIACFWAARTARAGWDVRAQGVAAGGRRLLVYGSAETHTWIQKAADLSGLGTDAVRWIPTDRELRMDVALLRKAIAEDLAAGHQPFMVVATAGSVSTGAIDPVPDIVAICREHGLWCHVDGAYGGFAAALPDAPQAFRGIADADSVAVDPHKWLYAPLEAGCALVRDPEHLRAAFAYHPPYYHLDERVTNLVDFGPQNSRGFRALKVWLALKQVGASGYRQMISDDIRLSRLMFDAVSRHPELEAATQSLSITTFRYVPADLRGSVGNGDTERYLNELNAALLDAIQRGGEAFVSNAVVHGRYLLRACIVNFHTSRADVNALPDIVVRLGRTLDEKLRSSSERTPRP